MPPREGALGFGARWRTQRLADNIGQSGDGRVPDLTSPMRNLQLCLGPPSASMLGLVRLRFEPIRIAAPAPANAVLEMPVYVVTLFGPILFVMN